MEPFTSIRLRRYAPRAAMAEHRHDQPSLCVVLTGGYQETIRARTVDQGSGALLFCPADEPHSQLFGGTGASKLILDPNPGALGYLSDHIRLEDAPAIRSAEVGRLGRRMAAELAIGDMFSRIALDGLSCELLALFGRAARAASDTPSRWVQAACDYMAAHQEGPATVRDVAAAVGCHPIRLSRAFRRTFGSTIGEYQRRLRVARASELLRQTHMPLAEIAAACGFCDQSHLTRAFKAELGCTPGSYRRT
ncbi:MAG: AraC family transcriptional regulator [Pseudomonadota bacterium]|uniref:helix-turn-helix transcriptional regulator n=1 Tax=Sphingomonas sp. ERG5 TaxID=1381597 RepID=UPI00068A4AA2|nr:AraC family transcriptional regulator [Sphingomonas sp. ERG5]